MIRVALALMFIASLRVTGATWYLDADATGANNGTNWANAWNNVTSVVWGASGVKAGDTLSISSGVYTNATLVVGASGTSSSWIRIDASRESGHNTTVPRLKSINFNGNQWVWVNGAKDTNYSFQTGGSIYTNQAIVTNNIGLQVSHDSQNANSQGFYVSGASGANNWIDWVQIGPVCADVNTNGWDSYGIRFLNITTNGNFKVRGCWMHHCKDDNANLNDITGTNPTSYDATLFESCYMQGGGDDGIQWTENGLTLRNNFFDGHMPGFYLGHPDHIQFSGSARQYLKIINNVFNGNGNSIMKGEHLVTEGSNIGDWIIAGNYFYAARGWEDIYEFGEPLGNQAWRANNDTNVNFATQNNVYYLNNTFYYLRNGSGLPWFVGRADPTNGTRSVWVLNSGNGYFANNLGVDQGWNRTDQIAWSWQGNGAGGGANDTNGIYYTTNSVRWVNNVLAGSVRSFKYYGQTWTNGEHLGMGNVSTMPSLISTNTYDFRLATNDTVAVGTGFDWSTVDSLTNNHPELMVDLFGNPRFRSGVVDRGAASLYSTTGTSGIITNGLVLRISFDDTPADADDGYDDTSGYGHHAIHLGYLNAHSASNRVPQQFVWTNTFNSQVQTGATFLRYKDGWDEYNSSGSYVGVTNRLTGKLWAMPVATIMFWGRYGAHQLGDAGYTNWTAGANRTFISGGYGYSGAWAIQLDGAPWTQLTIYTNNNANANASIRWDDRINQSTPGQIGSSTNMVHYTLTWSNGLAVTIQNGIPFRTNQFIDASIGGGAFLTNLTIMGPAGTAAGMLEIGGDSHNANPLLTYMDTNGVLRGDDGDGSFYEVTGAKQVPNHGWLGEGDMDDLRIYERVLTTNEIYQIITGTETGGGVSGGGGGGGSTNGNGPFSIRANTVRVGRIIKSP